MNREVLKLIVKCEKEAKIKAQKEIQEFLDSWLRKGSLLRQLFDIEQSKQNND